MRRSLIFLFVALVLVVGACGGGKKKASGGASNTTTTAPPVIAPLTGQNDVLGAAHTRCAVTVKIDNTQLGHPKYGAEQADVVYEEVVEGGYTRLAEIFNSHAPDRVGPVRSVRKTDQSVVWPIGGVFVYSGGAQYAIDSINTAPVVQLDENRAGPLMFRDPSRRKPLNLYVNVDATYGKCGKPVPPPPLFTYRAPGVQPAGDPIVQARVGFLGSPSFAVTWTWDVGSGTWKRSIFGAPEIAASGVQLAPKNVVIMGVQYIGGDPRYGNIGAEAQLVGTGPLTVLTGGKAIKGTWSRPDKSKPAQLLDTTGATIPLTPGQTWVELPDQSYTNTLTPAAPVPTPTSAG
jgi:hypothetical protein